MNDVLSEMKSLVEIYQQIKAPTEDKSNNQRFLRNGEGALNVLVEGNILFLLSTWFNDCDSGEIFIFNIKEKKLERVLYLESLPTGSFITVMCFIGGKLVISTTGFSKIHSNAVMVYEFERDLYKPKVVVPSVNRVREVSLKKVLMKKGSKLYNIEDKVCGIRNIEDFFKKEILVKADYPSKWTNMIN